MKCGQRYVIESMRNMTWNAYRTRVEKLGRMNINIDEEARHSVRYMQVKFRRFMMRRKRSMTENGSCLNLSMILCLMIL